jgi:hypothetical protein
LVYRSLSSRERSSPNFDFRISIFEAYAARASLAARLEWKPLINVFDISSRWIWLVPS